MAHEPVVAVICLFLLQTFYPFGIFKNGIMVTMSKVHSKMVCDAKGIKGL
jgi:hypothetical protein